MTDCSASRASLHASDERESEWESKSDFPNLASRDANGVYSS